MYFQNHLHGIIQDAIFIFSACKQKFFLFSGAAAAWEGRAAAAAALASPPRHPWRRPLFSPADRRRRQPVKGGWPVGAGAVAPEPQRRSRADARAPAGRPAVQGCRRSERPLSPRRRRPAGHRQTQPRGRGAAAAAARHCQRSAPEPRPAPSTGSRGETGFRLKCS